MIVKVNGETRNFEQSSLTVASTLQLSNVESPEMVSVQRNGEFVDRAAYESTEVKENDEIDFLYFMGGGRR